jgi:methionyl-tRNA formyltransferase
MKVLLIGSNQITVSALATLHSLSTVNVVGVVTAPQQFQISYAPTPVTNINHGDLVSASKKLDIRCHVAAAGMKTSDVKDFIHRSDPNIIFVIGWHHMIPRSLTEKYLVIGIHASLLPRYRGGAPLVWAMINGETQSGVTLFRFNESVDGGPIIDQQSFSIESHEAIADVLVKAEVTSLDVTKRFFSEVSDVGRVRTTSQSLSDWPIWPQRTPTDGFIDPTQTWTTERLYNFIRAQSAPYPGAFAVYREREFTIWRASGQRRIRSQCGDGIHGHENELCYRCVDGCLVIDDFAPRKQ